MESIAANVSRCLDAFRILCTALQIRVDTELAKLRVDNVGGISLSGVKDELGRFKVWVGNIGAHRTGRSSLDHRLRDASHIRKQVVRLLEDLAESLLDGWSHEAQDTAKVGN
jgi:hypothetical protein